ncbi:arylsulfatase [Chitiniphilus shinanonensis]|uniref:arylsulfatase n=1 Tax=Chitiniphilus shinanonensis TaxID=553088 RepID=UPI00333E73E0
MPHPTALPLRFGRPAMALAIATGLAVAGCNSSDSPSDATPPTPPPTADARPNILYIMADDLGYSDIHAFGGEIDTPNLDALVADGRILTNHHTGTVSAITRAMLISGTDHHLVGEGTMGAPQDERKGLPGYEGYLNDSSLSVAQLLRDNGYHTYIAGKWHLGSSIAGDPASVGKTPDQWGFERSFALLGGAATNHFGHEAAGSKNYTEDGRYVQPGQTGQPGGVGGTPEVFYSTDFYTDKLIAYIDANRKDGKPFFAYAAYTSPHWPLQVPEPWLSQYKGRYDQGYEPIAAARYARLQALGLIPAGQAAASPSPETTTRSPATANDGKASAKYINALHPAADGYVDYGQGRVVKKWSSLTADEKKAQARYMEIYAGMVSNLDHNIGRLIQYLKDTGQYDNTFILFQSDNGAEGWPIDSGADPLATDTANAQPGRYELLGTDTNFGRYPGLSYGLRWAEVSATPFAQVKGQMGEGSISTPAIAKLPGQKKGLPPLTVFTHVTDNTATFLALAGVTPPAEAAPPLIDPKTGKDANRGKVIYNGRYVYPVTGKSLVGALQQATPALLRTTPFGEESYGRTAIYSADGRWKARFTEPPFGPLDGHWELFDLSTDRGETNDLSAQYPQLTSVLVQQWQGYMDSVGGVNPLRPKGFY